MSLGFVRLRQRFALAFAAAILLIPQVLLAQAPSHLIYQPKGSERLVKLLPAGANEWVAVLKAGAFRNQFRFIDNTSPLEENSFQRTDSDIVIVHLNAAAKEISRVSFGGIGYDEVVDAFVARDGRVTVIGNTDSPDFPAIAALFPDLQIPDSLPHEQSWGFVLRTNPAGTAVESATLIGGAASALGQGTHIVSAAVDGQGSLYLTGISSHADLPTTEGAWKRNSSIGIGGKRGEGFLLKLSADLRSMPFSTFFGADAAICPLEGATCSADNLVNAGLAVVVGAGNQPIVLFGSTGKDLLATDGAVDRTPALPDASSGAPLNWNLFLTRFSADGSTLAWQAGLGESRFTYPLNAPKAWLRGNRDGSVISVVEPAFEDGTFYTKPYLMARWSADGSTVLAERELANVSSNTILDVAVGFDGLIRTIGVGNLRSPFMVNPFEINLIPASRYFNGLAATWFLTLDSTSLDTVDVDALPLVGSNPHFAAVRPGGLTVFEAGGRISTYPLSANSGPAILAITPLTDITLGGNSTAAFDFVKILGRDLTPADSVSASFDRNGDLPTELAGISVRVGGFLCPLLRVGDDAIELITPEKLNTLPENSVVDFAVYDEGMMVAHYPMATRTYNLRVFGLSSGNTSGDFLPRPLVIRADGSLSSYENPLEVGEAFTVYLSGGGPTIANVSSGRRVDEAMPWTNLNAALVLGWPPIGPEFTSEAEYFGTAPGFAAGTIQANLRVPSDLVVPPPNSTVNGVVTTSARIRLRNGQAPDSPVVTETGFQIWIRIDAN